MVRREHCRNVSESPPAGSRWGTDGRAKWRVVRQRCKTREPARVRAAGARGARLQRLWAVGGLLGTRLEHDIERSLGSSAELPEPALVDHDLAQPALARLRPQRRTVLGQ